MPINTQITGRQIAPATILQANLGLVAAVNPSDAVIYSQLTALITGRALKAACRVVALNADLTFSSYASNVLTTTANIVTADGITLLVGDRVLITSFTSTNAKYNGIYTFTVTIGTAQFTRSADANTSGTNTTSDLTVGTQVNVFDGNTLKRTQWLVGIPIAGAEVIILNTDPVNIYDITPIIPQTYTPVLNEAPTGTQNGTNTVFAITRTPATTMYSVLLNGSVQKPGAGNDYVLSGTGITFTVAPAATDILLVNYFY